MSLNQRFNALESLERLNKKIFNEESNIGFYEGIGLSEDIKEIKQALTQPTKEQLRDEIISEIKKEAKVLLVRFDKSNVALRFKTPQGSLAYYDLKNKKLTYIYNFSLSLASKIIKYFELEEE